MAPNENPPIDAVRKGSRVLFKLTDVRVVAQSVDCRLGVFLSRSAAANCLSGR